MLLLLSLIAAAPAPTITAETATPILDAPIVDAPIVDASGDEVASLVSRGKDQLVAGRSADALATFRAAHEKSGSSAATEIWVLRGRIAVGELDEAFERVIDIESDGIAVPGLDYVIGVARYEAGRRAEAQGASNAGNAYQEAAAYLGEALAGDEDAYPDAWKMYAASSRWIGEIETASKAIDRALAVSRDGETLSLASKIRVARGVALLGDESTKAAGRRAIEQGVADAQAAAKALGTDVEDAAAQADVHLQLAVGLLYLERKSDAADAYAVAMEWDPTQVDYGQLYGTYTDADGTVAPFVDVVSRGSVAFTKRWGGEIDSDAGMLWWLGYGEFMLGRYEDSITSMGRAVAKYPAYANAHWYIALSQYYRGKQYDELAAASFRTYADADPAGFTAMMTSDTRNKAFPGAVLGRLWGASKFEAAADLAEVRLTVDENDPLLWNDVGLMNRDAGEHVMRARVEEPRRSAKEYFERSWEAYQRAIELDRKPQYLNDGAVLLHYYLERDYDKAIAMYDEAEALATKMLDSGEVRSDERDIVEIALRDSRDNRAKLKRKIEKQKQGGGAR